MLGHIKAFEVDPNFKLTSNLRRSLSSTSQLAHLNCELLHHFYTFREIIEIFTRSRNRITGVVLIVVCELAKDAQFSAFSGGLKRACSRKFNFSNF